MLSTRSLVALSLSLLALADLTPVDYTFLDNVVSGDKYIKFPVQTIENNSVSTINKRQDAVTLTNSLTGLLYMIKFNIGGQAVNVQIDTGSSELWVNPDCANAVDTEEIDFCQNQPQYVPGSSAKNLGLPFHFFYGLGLDTVDASGTYFTDDMTLGSASITAQQFGFASLSHQLMTGILGVGPHTDQFTYSSVIESLQAQGKTNTIAFSLDLRSVSDPSGSIIFGGIDSKKYKCNLEKRDIIPANQAPGIDPNFPRYWLSLTGVGQTVPGKSPKAYPASTFNPASVVNGLPVFPDSGSTICHIPPSLFTAIGNDYPNAVLNSQSLYEVPCDAPAGSIEFSFGPKTISVPYSDFIWDNGGSCVLGIQSTTGDEFILGDSFLRAAYLVYDNTNQNIWLDQADNCGSNLVGIEAGANGVP